MIVLCIWWYKGKLIHSPKGDSCNSANRGHKTTFSTIINTRHCSDEWRQHEKINQSASHKRHCRVAIHKISAVMRLVVEACDAAGVFWRGHYVSCKFIHSDCGKVGDEKYVTGKYSQQSNVLSCGNHEILTHFANNLTYLTTFQSLSATFCRSAEAMSAF